MTLEEQYALNVVAYRLLKEHIKRTYPPNQFVAVAEGRIVADAPTFDEVERKLNDLGYTHPMSALVEQAGYEPPRVGSILGSPVRRSG